MLESMSAADRPSLPQRRRSSGHPRGLTLLELAAVLAVAAILGALAVPSLSARLDRQRTQSAAEKLSGDLAEARFESARRDRPLTVWTQPGAAWCWAVATTAVCDCRLAQAPCLIRTVRSTDHPGVLLMQGQVVRLDPAGSANGGEAGGLVAAVFETRRGERLRVAVSALGRAHVCAESGTWAHVPAC
jgi:prepilin-type N-terminal cleavage/methylation domain-containing protein